MDFAQITRRAFIWSVAKYTSWLLALILSHSHTLFLQRKHAFFLSILSLLCHPIKKNNLDFAVFSHSSPGVHVWAWRNHHRFESKHTNIHERDKRWIYIIYHIWAKLSVCLYFFSEHGFKLLKNKLRGALLWTHDRKVFNMRHIFRSFCRQHIEK